MFFRNFLYERAYAHAKSGRTEYRIVVHLSSLTAKGVADAKDKDRFCAFT